jgi:predicted GNAT family acetyltransferase
VVWAGGANFGFGPLFYVHDLRIFPPYRRKGYAAEVLETLATTVKQQEALRGMALSVMAGNVVAADLYAKSGFRPVSTVMFKPA